LRYPHDLGAAELKHEVEREPFSVAQHGLVENTGFDSIKLGKIRIEKDLLPANAMDSGFNNLSRDGFLHLDASYLLDTKSAKIFILNPIILRRDGCMYF
jgi:hypothetical protein